MLGFTSSAAAQIGDRFNPVAANEVVATVVSADASEAILRMPADAIDRAKRIIGVRTAGIGYPLDGVEGRVSRTTLDHGSRVPLFGATTEFLDGVGLEMNSGTRFSGWHDANASRIVVLGPQAARAISYGAHQTGSVVWIDGVRFTVAGVISDVAARPELLSAAIIPASTARTLYPAGRVHQNVALRLTTDSGAARVVGDQLSLALDPTREAGFEVSRPPEIDDLRVRSRQ